MELWIGFDAERFHAAAGQFVTSGVERNVLATVLDGARRGDYSEAIFGVVSDERGDAVAALIRTPPHKLLAAGVIAEPAAFMQAWLGIDPGCPGISAEPALAQALRDAWRAETGGRVKLDVSEALHVLTRVVPPPSPAPGSLRVGEWREAAQLAEWGVAFATDAHLSHPELAAASIQRAIEEGRMYVWEHDGTVVSMAGHRDPVAGTVRIGPVYTPTARRGNGYATALTAALSQLQLDRGAERCMLYTDVSNPISNHIYAGIGYVRVSDWEEWLLLP